MKIYNYEKINQFLICGGIQTNLDDFIEEAYKRLPNKKSIEFKVHPKELERQERIRKIKEENESIRQRLGLRAMDFGPMDGAPFKRERDSTTQYYGFWDDTVVVVCGDCGIGGKDVNTFLPRFERLNKALVDNNTFILFVRGNNDNPQLFSDETINLSNVKLIPDYSVLILKTFNCLCLGGSISLDREWKKSQQERLGRPSYWENECFAYKEDEVNEIIDKFDIACIVSNTCPSFAFPGTNSFNKTSWVIKDKTLLKDILGERKAMDKVYERFIDKDKKPFAWVYTKYDTCNDGMINDIIFQSIGKKNLLNLTKLLEENFSSSFSKKQLSINKEVIDEVCNRVWRLRGAQIQEEDAAANWINADWERDEEVRAYDVRADEANIADELFEAPVAENVAPQNIDLEVF